MLLCSVPGCSWVFVYFVCGVCLVCLLHCVLLIWVCSFDVMVMLLLVVLLVCIWVVVVCLLYCDCVF